MMNFLDLLDSALEMIGQEDENSLIRLLTAFYNER